MSSKRRASQAPTKKTPKNQPKRPAKRATTPQVAVFRPGATEVSFERKTLDELFRPGKEKEPLAISPCHTLWLEVADPRVPLAPNPLFHATVKDPTYFPDLAGLIVLEREPPKSIGSRDIVMLPELARGDAKARSAFLDAMVASGAQIIHM